MTTILVWNDLWGELPPIPRQLPEGCQISTDRCRLADADAVVFHLPTLDPALIVDDVLKKRRGQRWVAWSCECDLHYPWLADPGVMARFDLRMTYRLDSHVPCTYVPPDFLEQLAPWSAGFVDFEHRERVLANAFISGRCDRSDRRVLLLALMDRMAVDSYGTFARNQEVGEQDGGASFKMATQARYLFSLAFENVCHPDYVTEKFFQPLLVGSVPVVLGAPNVSCFAPGEQCYVDVRDFTSLDSLVAFLTAVAADRQRYEAFHAWRHQPLRQPFMALVALQQQSIWTRLCHRLQQP